MTAVQDRWRLRGLEHYEVLGLRGDPSLQRITRLAALIARTESAGIHIIGDTHQHRIAGVNAPLDDWPVQDSMCRLAVEEGRPIVAEDATEDPRFAASSFVRGAEPVRFYVSTPLVAPGFGPLGSLCVWDRRTGRGRLESLDPLADLAEIALDALESARTTRLLRQMAVTDPLTGVANRRHVEDEVGRRLAEQRRTDVGVALAYVDLDRFKQVNDTHGHAVGDQLLATVARRLGEAVRADEVVGRIGGDEFVVVGRADLAERAAVARLLAAVDGPVDTAAGVLPLRASLGVAVARPGDTVASLLARGDAAMFAVKRRGPVAGGC